MNTNAQIAQLQADFEFCQECPEEFRSRNGGTLAPMLRTVAALNPEASKEEFIRAMVDCGVHKNTAAIQYRASRKFDAENY